MSHAQKMTFSLQQWPHPSVGHSSSKRYFPGSMLNLGCIQQEMLGNPFFQFSDASVSIHDGIAEDIPPSLSKHMSVDMVNIMLFL